MGLGLPNRQSMLHSIDTAGIRADIALSLFGLVHSADGEPHKLWPMQNGFQFQAGYRDVWHIARITVRADYWITA